MILSVENNAVEETQASLRTPSERRPKRCSSIKVKIKDNERIQTGRVKTVGKGGSKNKDTCWIETDEKEELVLDFMKDIESWQFVEKSKLNVDNSNVEVNFVSKENYEKNKEWKERETNLEEVRSILSNQKRTFRSFSNNGPIF